MDINRIPDLKDVFVENALLAYTCPKCGDVLQDQIRLVDVVDTLLVDVYPTMVCNSCNSIVVQQFIDVDGSKLPVMQQVDPERWMFAMGFYVA